MINLRRSINLIDKKYMYKFYGEEYSLNHLTKIKAQKLRKLEPTKNLVDNFFMNLIADWIEDSYEETDSFIFKLKRLIKKTTVELKDVEKDHILILEERIFSRIRHIKKLLVNIDLDPKETAGAKFKNAKLFENDSFVSSGDLIITNNRIIIESDLIYSFYYDEIKKIQKSDEGLLLIYPKRKILIKIHDQKTLINTFNNLYNKKVHKFV